MTRRALLLINRHARRGKQAFAQAIDLLDDLDFELITVPVKAAKSSSDFINHYADSIDLVIVGGGDGTLNSVVNSLVEHHVPLGI
jgi:diacylglycerol kinase family enzyme